MLPLKVLVSRLVIKYRMDYSSYLNGVAKEELDSLDKLAGDFKIETVKFTHQGRKVATEDLEQFKECLKQMLPKKVTDFFFGRREISIVERISSRWRTWVIYDMDGREKNMMCSEGFYIKDVPGLLQYYEDYIEDGKLVNSDKWFAVSDGKAELALELYDSFTLDKQGNLIRELIYNCPEIDFKFSKVAKAVRVIDEQTTMDDLFNYWSLMIRS